ncbi:MAG: hypothetical protein ACR2L8_05800 [Solirubrobacteraceae bacterium]
MALPDPAVLPAWPPGTVAILSTGGAAPHAIPVSTGVRAGPRTILFALARRRESLTRLRAEPRCALTLLDTGVALTAHARATVVQEPMAISDRLVAVRLDVERIQDHGSADFRIDGGVRWRWTDAEAERRDAELRRALAELAA